MRPALVACLALAGCAVPTPTVEIVSATPGVLSASDDAGDDLTIRVRYADPDGDLGQGTARITDCRAEGLITVLPIPRIANDDAVARGAAIEGELTLVAPDIGVVAPSGAVPEACAMLGVKAPSGGAQVFCVSLTDAAGNESDGACTPPITVEP